MNGRANGRAESTPLNLLWSTLAPDCVRQGKNPSSGACWGRGTDDCCEKPDNAAAAAETDGDGGLAVRPQSRC